MDLRIVILGAGNLATRLSIELKQHHFQIEQIYSRTAESASALADILDCPWTNDVNQVIKDADLYILSVSDSAFENLLHKLSIENGLLVHTSGSMPMQSLADFAKRIGVFYPLQSFSKQRDVDFSSIPICIEALNQEDENILFEIGHKISSSVQHIDSIQRRSLHLAAVFCSNFANHCYALAGEIASEQGVDFELLKPLIRETAAKIECLSPKEAQTGPAVRYDQNVMGCHESMLETHPLWRDLYSLISKSIFDLQKKQ
ncbi:MAG: DUF2520 domain-containing protein [Bacteroidota bacterium]|nr:DUF2520 domain-containing protein [Bacteroidota bacterium]